MDETTKPNDNHGAEPEPEPRIGADGKPMAPEYGGYKGPEPTRHGDWDVNGRVSDF